MKPMIIVKTAKSLIKSSLNPTTAAAMTIQTTIEIDINSTNLGMCPYLIKYEKLINPIPTIIIIVRHTTPAAI
jgi:hypothetical protein